MNFEITEAVALLRRTPAALTALLAPLPAAWLSAAEGPDTWSPRDVVAHLTDLEETDWMPRVRWIRSVGTARPLMPVDRVRFRQTLSALSIDQLLDLFAERRGASLDELGDLRLDHAQLDTAGTHPDLGDVTLRQLLATWVVHDLTHVAQISRVMAKRYDGDVGPWKAYLSVLAPRTNS